jgi:hypothetical protein
MTQTAPTRAIVLGIYRTAHCQKMLNKCIHAATRPERTKRPDMTIKRTMQRTSPGLADWLGVVRTGFNPSVFSDMLCWLPATVLLSMEESLRHPGLAGIVGELSGRLRRSRRYDDALVSEPTAAVTRWRVAALPAPALVAHSPETPGSARPRWRLDLVRCRGGEPASWIVEPSDATGHLGVPADLTDGPVAAPTERRRAAAG